MTKQEVQKILHESFEIPMDQMTNDNTLIKTLHIDSLDVADLIVNLEKTTGKRASLESFMAVKTLGDLYSTVGRLTESESQSSI